MSGPAEGHCSCGLELSIWKNSWNHEAGCSMQPVSRSTAVVGEGHLEVARALVSEWRTAAEHPEKRAGSEGFLVGLIAAALADAGAVSEVRDRELIARHLRSAASAVGVDDWPLYLRMVADQHAAGVSWYRP